MGRRRHVHVGSPDVEELLVAELRRHHGDVKATAPGVVVCGCVVDAVFARQVLVDARHVVAKNHAELAAALLDVDVDGDRASFDEGRIDVDAPEVARTGSRTRTRHPLADEAARLQDTLRKKAVGRREKGKSGPPTAHRLRVLLVGAHEAFCAVGVDDDDDPLTAWPSPFPMGRALVEEPKDAPSSAHRKLDEALAWLRPEFKDGDVAVDLGAAPGGWTHVLRSKGARVVAVDRADLDEDLVADPLVQHLRRDAADVDLGQTFAFGAGDAGAPAFVVCDVIWEPEKSIAVVEKAGKVPSLRGLVVTLKLKHPVDFDLLERARRVVDGADAFAGRIKHLMANKLEVTLMMRRR